MGHYLKAEKAKVILNKGKMNVRVNDENNLAIIYCNVMLKM